MSKKAILFPHYSHFTVSAIIQIHFTCRFKMSNYKHFSKIYILISVIALLFHCALSVWLACVRSEPSLWSLAENRKAKAHARLTAKWRIHHQTLMTCNKDGNIIHVLNCISTSVATVLNCMKWLYPLVFGDEFLAQGLHVKSHQRCSAGIRTCLSADQSSSSTLTESSFLVDPCLIHRDTVMLE